MNRFKETQKHTLFAIDRGKIALWQIKKVLHCHFPDLQSRMTVLADPRKGVQYSIEELVMGAMVLFLLRSTSRHDFNHKVKDGNFVQSYYRMFRLHLPGMDAVNDLFEKMDTRELEELRCLLTGSLIEKRVFHRLRFFGRYFCVAIDGTGVYHWGDSPPKDILPYALKREYSSGKVVYSSQVLEATLVCNNGLVIPLISEWIANDGLEYDKQDCELKAFKRLSTRLKKCFPRLNLCILADGLYTNISMMSVCQGYDWKFITVFKDGNLPSVWQEVESLLPLSGGARKCQTQVFDSTHMITSNYQWIKDIDYQKHSIHWVECVQDSEHRKTGEKSTNRFVFLTNLVVDEKKIASIIQAGRARWCIEDHFNTQKNRGGALHHKFNRNHFKAVKNWHNIRQLGCVICEFVKYTSEMKQVMKDNPKMTWIEIWKNLNAFLTMCVEEVKEVVALFEHWSKPRRQVRLE